MTTSNEHNNAPAVPQGWRISKTRLDGREATIVKGPGGGCVAYKDADIPRVVPESILYDLATTLLTATPAPAPAQDFDLTYEEIEAIAQKHMSTVGDHWCNEEAIRERHAEDFARAIIAALRAKGGK